MSPRRYKGILLVLMMAFALFSGLAIGVAFTLLCARDLWGGMGAF